jgi:peptidoglycan hydrolase CwlO-like protein
MHAATTTNNDARAMENYDLVTGLRTNSLENRKTIQQVAAHSADLAESLGDLQDNANEQRDELIKLREKIDANQHRVADMMFAM